MIMCYKEQGGEIQNKFHTQWATGGGNQVAGRHGTMWMPNFGKEGLELALHCITQSCLSISLHPYLSLILFPYAGCFNPQVTKLWFDVSQEPPGSVTCSTIVWSPFSQTSSYHCQNIPNFMLSPCMTGCDSEF